MFKNVPDVDTKCGQNASETFAEHQQFRDYLIQLYIFNFEQASIGLSYFTCSGTSLLLFLTSQKSNFIGKSTFKYIFAGKNEKKLLAEIFLSYQKIIFLMDVFLILQLSRNVRLPRK